MDLVTGGNCSETSYDSFYLFDLNLMDDHYSLIGTIFNLKTYSKTVYEAWEKAGVHVVTHHDRANDYSIND